MSEYRQEKNMTYVKRNYKEVCPHCGIEALLRPLVVTIPEERNKKPVIKLVRCMACKMLTSVSIEG